MIIRKILLALTISVPFISFSKTTPANSTSPTTAQYQYYIEISDKMQHIVSYAMRLTALYAKPEWACTILMDKNQRIVALYDTDSLKTHATSLCSCLANNCFSPDVWGDTKPILAGLHDCVWNNALGIASKSRWVEMPTSEKVSIIGKTGENIVQDQDKKTTQRIMSFVGIFPEDQPEYTCLVIAAVPPSMMDATSVCGFTIRRIAERIYHK